MEEKRVRVKAESYIKGQVTTHGCGEIKDGTDIIEESIALKAVEMVRKEEREKAIEALDIAIMTIFEKNNHSASIEKLIDQFKELLNE